MTETVTCVICHRVKPVDKMDGRRCKSKTGCHSFALSHLRARRLSKRAKRILDLGEAHATKSRKRKAA